jgi:hypothetical protein
MPNHAQVFVKVNAPVDRGAATLITVLSRFPKLQTLESCEDISGWAWVTFVYGTRPEQWQELAKFLFGFLGPRLTREMGDRVTVTMHVTDAGLYRAEMAVRIPAISAAVRLLAKLRTEFKD